MHIGPEGPIMVEGKQYFTPHPNVIGPIIEEPGGAPLDMPGDFQAIENVPYGAMQIHPFEVVSAGPVPGWMAGLGEASTTRWVGAAVLVGFAGVFLWKMLRA